MPAKNVELIQELQTNVHQLILTYEALTNIRHRIDVLELMTNTSLQITDADCVAAGVEFTVADLTDYLAAFDALASYMATGGDTAFHVIGR